MSRKFLTHKDGDVKFREFAGYTDIEVDIQVAALTDEGFDVKEIDANFDLDKLECMEYKASKFRVATKKVKEREKLRAEFDKTGMVIEALDVLINGDATALADFRKKWNGDV